MNKGLFKSFDAYYLVRFFSFFLLLYFFNQFYIGATSTEGRFYSAFLDHHLNYIVWLRNSILYTSQFITHIGGLKSDVKDLYTLESGELSVTLVYSCLSLGIISF